MTLPIQRWVKDLIHLPEAGVAKAQTAAQWATYLIQRSSLSLLKEELQKILGLVTYHSDMQEEIMVAPLEKSPVQEGSLICVPMAVVFQ